MGNYYGDIMLLKELMKLNNINLSLSDDALNIEVNDDFKDKSVVSINETEITIKCTIEDVVRAVNFNFDKNTISEIFSSPVGIGGEVYSMNGQLVKIIN